MANLEIKALVRAFGATRAVDDLSMTVDDGELVCLLGPSGSGKSTVLRMIGGFAEPTSGSILIDGEDVTRLPPERRPTGMVFQSHALWTHMDVFANLAFGLKLRRLPKDQIRDRVEAALEMVGLKGYGPRRTAQLSGGQQQRVALARSLVLEPKILLLDEPFASLDQHLRERLRDEVREIQRRAGITMIFVTHGQDEALAIADRIAVMREGRLEQLSPPDQLYHRPQTEFVAGFVGQMNLVPVLIRANRIETEPPAPPITTLALPLADGPATLALRPEDIRLQARPEGPGPRVTRATDFGTHLALEVEAPGHPRLKVTARPGTGWAPGMAVSLAPQKISLFREGRLCFTSAPVPHAVPTALPLSGPAPRANAGHHIPGDPRLADLPS